MACRRRVERSKGFGGTGSMVHEALGEVKF